MPRTFNEQDIIKLVKTVETGLDLTALLAESKSLRAWNIWKMMLDRMPDDVIQEYLKDREEINETLKGLSNHENRR
jgi:hypothetical protein